MKDDALAAFDIRIETLRQTRALLRDAHSRITNPLRKEGLGLGILIVNTQLDVEREARKRLQSFSPN